MATVTVDEQTAKSIQELADRLRKSPEEVVELAVLEKMHREQGMRQVSDARIQEWKVRLERNRLERQGSRTYEEIMDELYDENGLPH